MVQSADENPKQENENPRKLLTCEGLVWGCTGIELSAAILYWRGIRPIRKNRIPSNVPTSHREEAIRPGIYQGVLGNAPAAQREHPPPAVAVTLARRDSRLSRRFHPSQDESSSGNHALHGRKCFRLCHGNIRAKMRQERVLHRTGERLPQHLDAQLRPYADEQLREIAKDDA